MTSTLAEIQSKETGAAETGSWPAGGYCILASGACPTGLFTDSSGL